MSNILGGITRLQFSTNCGFQHCSNWQGWVNVGLCTWSRGLSILHVVSCVALPGSLYPHIASSQNIYAAFRIPLFGSLRWCETRVMWFQAPFQSISIFLLPFIHGPKVACFGCIQSVYTYCCIHTVYIYIHYIYICLSDSQHIFKHAGVFIPKHGNPNIMAM